MCFAGDGQGGTGGGGGSKVLYSSSTGSGIAPTALSLLLLVFPFSTLAVRQQLPWIVIAAIVLSSCAATFLGVVTAATFALLANGSVEAAAAAAWLYLPAATKALTYGNSQATLAASMAGDAASVAVAALAGALLTGVLCLLLSPWSRSVIWALREWYASSKAPPTTTSPEPPELYTLCCTSPADSALHDAGGVAGEKLSCLCFSISVSLPLTPEALAEKRREAAEKTAAEAAAAVAAAAARPPPVWRTTSSAEVSNAVLEGAGILRPLFAFFLRGGVKRGMLGDLRTSESAGAPTLPRPIDIGIIGGGAQGGGSTGGGGAHAGGGGGAHAGGGGGAHAGGGGGGSSSSASSSDSSSSFGESIGANAPSGESKTQPLASGTGLLAQPGAQQRGSEGKEEERHV
jgi:hypothetical protein